MPVITLPKFLDASIQASGYITAYEDVDGYNPGRGDLRATIAGTATVSGNARLDDTLSIQALVAGVGGISATATAKLSASAAATSLLSAFVTYGDGRATLPALTSSASFTDAITGIGYIPLLYSEAALGWYIPPEAVGGYVTLTGLSSSGLIAEPDYSETYIPALVGQGWLYTEGKDEVFIPPIFLQATLPGVGAVIANEQLDGRYSYELLATAAGVGGIRSTVTVDGTAYLSANISALGIVSATGVQTRRLAATISGTSTFNPSNDLGQNDPWNDTGGGYGYIGGFFSNGYDGERLVVTFNSDLFLWNPGYASGVYTHSFDGTLLFTDQYIGTLASAIYTEILATQTMSAASAFSGLVSTVSTFDSGLTLTSLQEAHKAFINTFTGSLSVAYSHSWLASQLVTFAGSLTLDDVVEGIKTVLGTFLGTLTFDDAIAALADIQATFFSTLRDSDTYLPIVSTTAAPVVGSCATWVIDVDTQASVQYDRFSFNSYAQRGTEYLAAAEDGIYLLDGDTDAGADISALVDLAVSRFATPQRKYFPSVYLGVTSTGKMLLKAEVDGQTWIYEANNATTNMANQRVDLGRGLTGSHWRFTLLNQDGLDFELESVEFLPFISSRRVY